MSDTERKMDRRQTFDDACWVFTRACLSAAAWKPNYNYLGAAYMTLIEAAFKEVSDAFAAVQQAAKSESQP